MAFEPAWESREFHRPWSRTRACAWQVLFLVVCWMVLGATAVRHWDQLTLCGLTGLCLAAAAPAWVVSRAREQHDRLHDLHRRGQLTDPPVDSPLDVALDVAFRMTHTAACATPLLVIVTVLALERYVR